MSNTSEFDLVVLVPGKDDQVTIDALLSDRCDALGIRPLRYKCIIHPRHDPGCRAQAIGLLELYVRQAWYALVMFDH